MGNIFTKFFSNKYNLWGIVALCNILIGYIIGPLVDGGTLFLIFFLLLMNNFCMLTYGVAQGMLSMGIAQVAFKKWLEKMDEEKKKNDTK